MDDKLPFDVQLIVHRYVFECKYIDVLRQLMTLYGSRLRLRFTEDDQCQRIDADTMLNTMSLTWGWEYVRLWLYPIFDRNNSDIHYCPGHPLWFWHHAMGR